MLVEKSNLLQRVRVMMIALVAIIGFGTMAMKPADSTQFRYGVTEDGDEWKVVADVTTSTDYSCDTSPTICTVLSSEALNPGDPIVVDLSSSTNIPGKFQ